MNEVSDFVIQLICVVENRKNCRDNYKIGLNLFFFFLQFDHNWFKPYSRSFLFFSHISIGTYSGQIKHCLNGLFLVTSFNFKIVVSILVIFMQSVATASSQHGLLLAVPVTTHLYLPMKGCLSMNFRERKNDFNSLLYI